MSWADDNFDRIYNDDYWDYLADKEKRERLWKRGIHIDRQGNRHKISEMTDKHLQNTINYFNNYNVKILEKELEKRKVSTT